MVMFAGACMTQTSRLLQSQRTGSDAKLFRAVCKEVHSYCSGELCRPAAEVCQQGFNTEYCQPHQYKVKDSNNQQHRSPSGWLLGITITQRPVLSLLHSSWCRRAGIALDRWCRKQQVVNGRCLQWRWPLASNRGSTHRYHACWQVWHLLLCGQIGYGSGHPGPG